MQILISKLAILLFMIILGYVGARKGIFNEAFTKTASSLTINVFLIGTILSSVITDIPDIPASSLGWMVLITAIDIALCCVVGILGALPFRKRTDKEPLIMLLAALPNSMFVGAPIVQELYGGMGVFYLVLTCLPFNLFLYTYGVWRLEQGSGSVKFQLREMVTPPLISSLAALLIFAFRIRMPDIVVDLCELLGGATSPMSMLVIGASLGSVKLFDALRQPLTYVAAFLRLIVCPLVVWLVLRMFVTDEVLLDTMIINASVPSAVIVTVLAIQHENNAQFSSEAVLVTMLLSMITMPVVTWLLI